MNRNARGQLDRSDIYALEQLRTRLMPLANRLESLKYDIVRNPTVPPDWPSIQRHVYTVSQLINSVQVLLHEKPKIAESLKAYHPYPISPFPGDNPSMAAIAQVLLRKRPDLKEDDWIRDRLAMASEFAHVPSEWGIEPKRKAPAKTAGKDEDGSDGEGVGKVRRLQRQQRHMGEDDLAELLDSYLKSPSKEGQGSASLSSPPEDSQMVDADDTPEKQKEDEEREKKKKEEEEEKRKKKEKERVMPLEPVSRFMMTGSTEPPKIPEMGGKKTS